MMQDSLWFEDESVTCRQHGDDWRERFKVVVETGAGYIRIGPSSKSDSNFVFWNLAVCKDSEMSLQQLADFTAARFGVKVEVEK